MDISTIYGPPGTGKTHRLKILTGEATNPSLCLSFTKSAAKELLARGVGEGSTLHSLAYRLLGLDSAQVVNRDRLTNLANKTGITFRGSQGNDFLTAGDEYLSLYDYARNTFTDPSSFDLLEKVVLGTAGEFLWFIKVYESWKEDNYLVDFTDMIHRALLAPLRDIDHKIPEGVKNLVIDEAQDLNLAQWRFIDRIIACRSFDYIWVAGDDDQAIFTWAGATAQGMQTFASKYKAKEVILDESFRIPSSVHEIARGVLGKIQDRKEKEYTPRNFVGTVKTVHTLHNAMSYDVILYRNHSIGVEIARDLSQLGIPFVGENIRSPMSSKYAKSIIDYLTLLRGVSLRDAIVRKLEAITGTTKDVLCKRKKHWSQVIPTPLDLKQKLLVIENRFGDLTEVSPVELSTIHKYKGKEKNAVLLIDSMNERTRESMSKDPSDEYRVFYVGVTRAKDTLGIYEGVNPLGIRRLHA